jgi:hypothetical protein
LAITSQSSAIKFSSQLKPNSVHLCLAFGCIPPHHSHH